MLIFKAFEKGFRCRGYQYKGIGELNVTEKANAARCGFHGAEDPMDCVLHYRAVKNPVYCICEAGGDIDEDAVDSKVVCTELTIIKVLSMRELVANAIFYMVRNPKRKVSGAVSRDSGTARNGLCLVRGQNPRAEGKLGDVLGFVRENGDGEIIAVGAVTVDGELIKENVVYRMAENGEVAEDEL